MQPSMYSRVGCPATACDNAMQIPHLPCLHHCWSVTVSGLVHFSQSKSQSCVTTDGQSPSLSWCQAPIWGLREDVYYCQTVSGLLMWGALSHVRTGLSFTIETCTTWRSKNPRSRVVQLDSRALGSLYVVS
jgi:hypothetical protein